MVLSVCPVNFRSTALPFIQRGTYSHTRGRMKDKPYSFQDITLVRVVKSNSKILNYRKYVFCCETALNSLTARNVIITLSFSNFFNKYLLTYLGQRFVV